MKVEPAERPLPEFPAAAVLLDQAVDDRDVRSSDCSDELKLISFTRLTISRVLRRRRRSAD